MTAAAEAVGGKPRRVPLVIGLGLLLTLAFFATTLWSFGNTWGRYDYAHGWLVPVVLAWLIWSDRDSFRHPRGGDPLLLVPIVGLSAFWLLSTIMHIQLFYQTAFVLIMVCWGLYVFGRRAARTVIISGAVVLLSMPLWDPLLPTLRRITTLMSGAMVTVLGVPADIDGDLIHLPAGTFEIADGCAGLNYLLSALVIGLVYAQVLVCGIRARLLVVAMAAAISIIGNWIRVAALVVIGHVSEMQAWLVPNHLEFGWAIFAFGLLLFFYLAGKAERWVGRPRVAGGGNAAAADAGEARSTNGETTVRGSHSGSWLRRVGGVTAAAVIGPVLYFGIMALPSSTIATPGLESLAAGIGWRVAAAEETEPLDWRPDYRGAQEHQRVVFTDGTDLVYGDRFVYLEQAQNAKLVGWPNRIAPTWETLDEQVIGPVDPRGRLRVRQAVVRTEDGAVLTWYWYRVGGTSTYMPMHAKLLEIPAFLTRQRTSELIAFSAECDGGDCAGAFETLAGVMGTRRSASTAGASADGAEPATALP